MVENGKWLQSETYLLIYLEVSFGQKYEKDTSFDDFDELQKNLGEDY